MDESELVAYLRTASPSEAEGLLSRMWHADSPEVRKALWAYRHAMARMGMPAVSEMTFSEEYAHACKMFASCAVNPQAGTLVFDSSMSLDRCFLLGWHFPEYPYLIAEAVRRGVLCLLAKLPVWLEPLADSGCAHVFWQASGHIGLTRSLRQGRPVFAMIDHVYPGSPTLEVPFMGYQTRVPKGPFELAARFGYRCVVLTSPLDGRVRPLLLDGGDAAAMASAATRSLSSEILRRPAHWLMWPAVDGRWMDVDYDGGGHASPDLRGRAPA